MPHEPEMGEPSPKPDSSGSSPEHGLPTEEEIARLPPWARVAFAARCARRVQPLFRHHWPQAPEKHVIALDTAIMLAAQSAANAYAANAYDDAYDAYFDAATNAAAYADTAAAAAYAACAAAAANAANADIVYAAATNAASNAAARGGLIEAMRFDYELLRETATREKWDDKTPIPPEFFGPIWPFGVPEDWPVKQGVVRRDISKSATMTHPDGEREQVSIEGYVEGPEEKRANLLQVEFAIPQGVDREEADRLIGELILRANELHLAYGGSGLRIVDAKAYETEPALEPVGQGGGY